MEIKKEQMEKIRQYCGKDFDEKKLYAFSLILCDNEIDRDNEKFTVEALREIAKLFIGKTGIFDHNPTAKNQVARIFDTEVVTDKSRVTADGEGYTYVKAYAYMVKSDETQAMIDKIEAGITKETSVGCSVSEVTCSVCGESVRDGCPHRKGRTYNGVKCFYRLNKPTDAYEWSFVAVPAQKNAGVIKKFKGFSEKKGGNEEKENEDRETAKRSVIKALNSLCKELNFEILGEAIDEMTEETLKKLSLSLTFAAEKTDTAPFCLMGKSSRANDSTDTYYLI